MVKQAMKTAENQKQPISVTHLQREFNVTNEMDQKLQVKLDPEVIAQQVQASARAYLSYGKEKGQGKGKSKGKGRGRYQFDRRICRWRTGDDA